MVLKVGASVPLVWRSPSSLQFGVDEPLVVLDGVSEGVERLVSALVGGISRSGFDMMTRSAGLAADAASRLLQQLAPVLADATPTALGSVAVEGTGPLAEEVRRLLEAEGVLATPDAGAIDLAVLVAGWVIAPEDHGSWLRRDIPHLPVVIGDSGVTVGPMVEPGNGPCLYCVHLTRTDEDAAWPAIATQLWTRPAPPMSRLTVAESAAFVVRRVLARLAEEPAAAPAAGPAQQSAPALSWRVNGAVSSRAWTQHAQCRCAVPAESDWAPAAALASPSSTRTAEAAAVPA